MYFLHRSLKMHYQVSALVHLLIIDLPDTAVTENGTCFVSIIVNLSSNSQKMTFSHYWKAAPYHAASSGRIKIAVQMIKCSIKKMKNGSISHLVAIIK